MNSRLLGDIMGAIVAIWFESLILFLVTVMVLVTFGIVH